MTVPSSAVDATHFAPVWCLDNGKYCVGQIVQAMLAPLAADDLLLLVAFANDASVRHASLQLGVPRSTVSWRLADLEKRLGQSLCLRQGRKLTLTRFGETLVRSASRAQAAMTELRVAASGETERLVVAAAPLFAEHVMPVVLPTLLARNPKLRVEFRLSHTFADIFEERVDIALRRGPLTDSHSLNAKKLGCLTMVYVAAPALLPTGLVDEEELAASLPWIRIGAAVDPFAIELTVGRRRRSVRVSPRVAVDHQRIALDLVRRGVGVARVNAFLVRDELESGALREVLPAARSTAYTFAVYPRRARTSPTVKMFLELLVASRRELDIWDK